MYVPISSAEDLTRQSIIQYGTLDAGSTKAFFEVGQPAIEVASPTPALAVGNKSSPKITINDTIIFFLKLRSAFWYFQTTAVSERGLIKLFPCILFGKYIYSLTLEMAGPVNQHCANCIDTLSFPLALATDGGARCGFLLVTTVSHAKRLNRLCRLSVDSGVPKEPRFRWGCAFVRRQLANRIDRFAGGGGVKLL